MVVEPVSELLYYCNNVGVFNSDLNGYFEQQFVVSSNLNKLSFGSTNGYMVMPTIEINAISSNNSIGLSWTVSSDFIGFTSSIVVLGNFEVEKRSKVTGEFENIGNVEYTEGTSSYSFIDNNPDEGKNEYRLRYESDDTGITSYSKYFSTDFILSSTDENMESKIMYYDFSGSKFVNNGASGELLIYSIDGQKIDQISIDVRRKNVDMRNLKVGAYIYSLILEGKTITKGRFVKI